MSDRETVRFYFAFNSPFAFLANTRAESLLDPLGVRIDARPVYSPRAGGGPDFESPKIKYLLEDVRRHADEYGLRLNPGPFADTRKACLGFLFAKAGGKALEYRRAVYAARWFDGKDIGDDHVLAAIADRVGLDDELHREAIANGEYAAELDRSNAAAEADGVFGFPFFLWNGQRFWGNDRLEWLVKAIRKGA